MRQNWKISVREGKFLEFSVETTGRTRRGTRKFEPQVGTFTLGRPKQVVSQGGGEAAWDFSDSTLTFIRTYPEGAYRIRFQFSRAAKEFKCSANAAFARENGTGQIKLKSPGNGAVTVITSARQISSSCKVTKGQ